MTIHFTSVTGEDDQYCSFVGDVIQIELSQKAPYVSYK